MNFSIFLALFIFLLLTIALTTLLERKVMGSVQRRRGPNVAGLFGFLQPIADGLKLFLKEIIVPTNANLFLFFIAPVFTLFSSILLWLVIPFNSTIVLLNTPYSMLFLLAVSSLAVYGIIFSGWASNSKYAFLGGLRSSAQMISYEVCISFIWLVICLLSESLNLCDVIKKQEESIWFVVPLFPLWIIFFIIVLAETNRAPFDLPEAEAEPVAGYNVEYSSIAFALFFLGEYANMALMSGLLTIFSRGGWLSPVEIGISPYFWFGMKVTLHLIGFIWVRATLPRYRYDQLMKLGRKKLMPLTIIFLLFSVLFIVIIKYYVVSSGIWYSYNYNYTFYIAVIIDIVSLWYLLVNGIINDIKLFFISFYNLTKSFFFSKNSKNINTGRSFFSFNDNRRVYHTNLSKNYLFNQMNNLLDIFEIERIKINKDELQIKKNKQINYIYVKSIVEPKVPFFSLININKLEIYMEQSEVELKYRDAFEEKYLVNKLVSLCTKEGKKKRAYKQVNKSFQLLKQFTKINPILFLKLAISQIEPFVFLHKIPKGNKITIYPRILPIQTRIHNALFIIIKQAFLMKNQYRNFYISLVNAILDNCLPNNINEKKVREAIEVAELNKRNIKYKKKGEHIFSRIKKKERFKLYRKIKSWNQQK
jgi:NADH-quinone oxidoreductase subunit H